MASELVERSPQSRFLFQIRDVQGRRWKSQPEPDFDKARDYFQQVTLDEVGRGTETAARCQFLIGETLLLQNRRKEALTEYHRVYLNYQGADEWRMRGLFQAAGCELELGDKNGATRSYQDLVTEFPNTEQATQAARKTQANRSVIEVGWVSHWNRRDDNGESAIPSHQCGHSLLQSELTSIRRFRFPCLFFAAMYPFTFRCFIGRFPLLTFLLLLSCAVLPRSVHGQTTGSSPVAETEADLATSSISGSAIPSSPQEIVHAIGLPFAIVFALASIAAMWCGIERTVLLRHRRVIPRAFVDRFLQLLRSGRMDKPNAIAVCQQDGSPMADVFLHGVRKWGKPSVEIEQAVIDGGERQISQLKTRLRVLNGVATLCPLIGLLGTVIGMIQAFNDIAESNAMGQAEQLARGIAMALLTTAAGLFIAIPALTVYMYLAGRIDALVMEMDRLGQELVHLISGEALREREGEVSAAAGTEAPKKTAPKK